jgi:hypothetical protein
LAGLLWLQCWLFDFDIPAIIEALTAFVLTVVLSWAATEALQRIPGATRILIAATAQTHT